MVTTSSGTRISSNFSPQRHVLCVPSSKLEFWNWKTHPPGLQGNQKYDCSSHAPTRQPATSGLGLLLSYSLVHFVQLTCWPLVPTSSTDVLYVLEVNVFMLLPLFLIFFEKRVEGVGLFEWSFLEVILTFYSCFFPCKYTSNVSLSNVLWATAPQIK